MRRPRHRGFHRRQLNRRVVAAPGAARAGAGDESPTVATEDFEPNIFIYDNFPGGIGLSPALFLLEKRLLEHGLKTIEICPCKDGCPSCVGPTKESGRLAKQVALDILKKLA